MDIGDATAGATYSLDVSQYTAQYDIVVKMNGSEVSDAISGNTLTLNNVNGDVELICTTKSGG